MLSCINSSLIQPWYSQRTFCDPEDQINGRITRSMKHHQYGGARIL